VPHGTRAVVCGMSRFFAFRALFSAIADEAAWRSWSIVNEWTCAGEVDGEGVESLI